VREALDLIDDPHHSHTTLIAIENTSNRGGGACYPLETVNEIGSIAKEHSIRYHCDGARLFNATIAMGVSATEYAAPCDTVSFCFSKGLGCPVGSVLAGSQETITKAYRFRKMVGGGMRQAGVIAAAGLYALDHHIDRLAEDHRRMATFRAALEGHGTTFALPSPTNIGYLDVPDAYTLAGAIAQEGVYALPLSPTRLRVVFHLDIDDHALDRAIEVFKTAITA
jgi:threonine aldolase